MWPAQRVYIHTYKQTYTQHVNVVRIYYSIQYMQHMYMRILAKQASNNKVCLAKNALSLLFLVPTTRICAIDLARGFWFMH